MIGWLIFLVVALPILLFGVFFLLAAARVRIDAGTIGLLIVRGAATSKALEPGIHYTWPYRHHMIQRYPLREQTYLAIEGAAGAAGASGAAGPAGFARIASTGHTDTTAGADGVAGDFADPPLRLVLGDRTAAAVQYTIRFRVRPADLKAIHDRFGPEGIMPIVRDRSRQVLIDDLSAPEIGYDRLFADARVALQASLGEEIASALAEEGFDLTLFTLRDVELGSVGETVQAAARARAELDLEVAAAAVRALRIRYDAEAAALLGEGHEGEVLRYRQLEFWRDLAQRWDGLGALPSVGPPAAPTPPAAPSASPEPAGRVPDR